MKPAPFTYTRPSSIAEACALLAADPEARPLAGGQTLVPMLAMRLARPTQLIDIAHIEAMRGIADQGEVIEIGAVTRQATVEHDAVVSRTLPLLAAAMPWVGHLPTRARGTIGGSLANADPAAEIALVAVALGAVIVVTSLDGDHMIRAEHFFLSPMTTALRPGSLVRGVRFPVRPPGAVGVGFAEINARASDFAFASAAAQVQLDAAGRISALAVAVGGATETPTRLEMSPLLGARPSGLDSMVLDTLRAALAPLPMMNDPHASESYRRRVTATLAQRAVATALDQARAGGEHAGHA